MHQKKRIVWKRGLWKTKCAIKPIIGLLFLFVCYVGSSTLALKAKGLILDSYHWLAEISISWRDIICISINCLGNLALVIRYCVQIETCFAVRNIKRAIPLGVFYVHGKIVKLCEFTASWQGFGVICEWEVISS